MTQKIAPGKEEFQSCMPFLLFSTDSTTNQFSVELLGIGWKVEC